MAPTDSSLPGSKINTNFELIYSLKADGNVSISKYRSKKTGMQVCIAGVEGPIVHGYLCIATEAHDDDGLPHTLEHLIFLGSEHYPYKGVLDLLANRCLASGTNAWTDTDHTCYTMMTAGAEGFLTLLPIYLDHVLYPLLTDSGFITEVHHINGEGDDAGVVYCEMQARENTGESRCHRAFLQAMYPGHCGYKSETGGLMKNLRESTSNEKVKMYHQAYYRPENLCIIVTGQVMPEDVFRAINPVEDKILSKGSRPEFERPWQNPVPALEQSVQKVVYYPCDEEDCGMVYIGWRGPLAKHFDEITAISILLKYLTETSVSPLQQEFVETGDPYCSSVSFSIIENAESCIVLDFENGNKGKLHNIKTRLLEILQDLSSGSKELDMERMATVIHRTKLSLLRKVEYCPHETVAFGVIGDFLYGNTEEDLEHRVHQIPLVNSLAVKGREYWINLLRKYLLEAPIVTIIGEPSATMSEEMSQEEKKRITKQSEMLKEEGLKKKSELFARAKESNEIEPPQEVITSVSLPPTSAIQFHPISRSSNHNEDELDNIPSFSLKGMPCRFQLDDTHTNFVKMFVLMDTSKVTVDLRLYLPLLMELILESPLLRDGTLVPYEVVVQQLATDTVSCGTSIGIGGGLFSCGSYAQVALVCLVVEEEKYHVGVKWLRELLYQTQFTAERVHVQANKMVNEIAELKRKGSKIASTAMANICFTSQSNHWTASMIRQCNFLKNILQSIKTNPELVLDSLNQLRLQITEPQNITVHMNANVENLSKKFSPRMPWEQDFFPNKVEFAKMSEGTLPCKKFLRPLGSGPNSVVIGVGAVESSYLIQAVSCIDNPKDPDLPALLVAIQYFTQLEGPLWRQVRGQGLTYSYSISLVFQESLLYFTLFKSTHIVSAYREAKNIVEQHLSGKVQWEQSLVDSSCSSLIFELVEKQQSVESASLQSLLAYYHGVNLNYTKEMIDLISTVTVEDVRKAASKYLAPLFDVEMSRCAICCHPSKVDEVVRNFKTMSRELTVLSSIEENLLSQMCTI
ncbi:uncharacterized protein C05D11.1-like [Tachypleus tridentatus]|uniref:uncharacterized protein C05D11.1-like n=1 Tax=Tachypleus tridentatus TaxID=6853 RepID=UPI003FCF6AC9